MRNGVHARVEIPLLARLLPVPPESDILETGCGRGVGLVALANVCCPGSLTGIDLDADLLRLARDRCAAGHVTADLVCGDICDLPFQDESFDLVIDFGTLYHVGPEERALREIARVLRIEGVLVHETPFAQLLAHPLHATRRRLSWLATPQLAPERSFGLWACRIKRATPGDLASP